MQFIIGLIIIALIIGLLSAIWPFFLFLAIMFVVWKIYESCYYKSSKFTTVKQRIDTYITDCNELNEHIENLKHTALPSDRTDYGNASYSDSSKWNKKMLQISIIVHVQFAIMHAKNHLNTFANILE